MTLARLIGVTVLLTMVATPPATANLRDSNGNFVFGGKHYKERSFDDPTLGINVIFRGGSPATSGRVAFHLGHGYRGWGKRTGFNCGGARYVPFPSPSRRNITWAAPSMQGSTNSKCLNQRHARFFNDLRHSQQFNHESTGNFLLAQVHGETAYRFRVFGPPSFGHKPSESYAKSRFVMLRSMSAGFGDDHYVDYRYVLHPGARGTTAGKPNDRIIGRVSNAHR